MKREVSRPSARAHDCIGALNVLQRSAIRVKAIDEDAIRAEVGGERETVRRIGYDAVCVRPGLTISNRSASCMLYHGRFPECSVVCNWKQSDTASRIIGDEHRAATAVH